MNSPAETTKAVLCSPTALAPIGLSLVALLIVVMHLGLFGSNPGPDQDATAFLWRLLMAAQIPALVLFAAKWFRKARRPFLNILAVHGFANAMCIGLAARAPLCFLKL